MDPNVLPNGQTDLRINYFHASCSNILVAQFFARANLLPRSLYRNTVGFTCRTESFHTVHGRELTDRCACGLPVVFLTNDHTCTVQAMLYLTRNKRGYLYSVTLELS